ncbi:hypothetical protein BGW38_001468, partial [Lunasporangiospora selenospora]
MSGSNIRVTIVGGGIGGLALANMFERANISYIILEKATRIRALGSSLGLDASSLPVMEQLGLLDDFYRVSKPVRHFNFYNESAKRVGMIDFSDLEEIGGYPAIILDRPAFYQILQKNIPKHKIFYNKRVLSVTQTEESATCQCADGSAYLSDIVIGADGAYSAVRQNIYKSLKQQGRLSSNDDKPLGYNQHCLGKFKWGGGFVLFSCEKTLMVKFHQIGVSEPLDPEKYPCLKLDTTDFEIVIPKDRPYYAIYMPLPNNRLSFAVIQNVPRADARTGDSFKFSEWGPEAAVEMAEVVRDLANPFGGTFGDIIDNTPTDLISKIMLEEKFFECWHDGRVVLLGDASLRDVTTVFETYYHQRSKVAKTALGKSRQFGKVMGDR